MRFLEKSKLILFFAFFIPGLLLVGACGPSAPASESPPGTTVADIAPASAHHSNKETGDTKATTGAPPQTVLGISFANGRMTPETIRVKRGDQVTLNLASDRPGSFHIHGYDLEQEVVMGETTPFQFLANATGRFQVNFHQAAGSESVPVQAGHTQPVTGDSHPSGGHMDHGPVESSVPINLDVTAEVAGNGGIHVAIKTEGWRWAPEEVNGPNSEGAGHAHIYADGVKLSRVYGGYHYIPSLEPGAREIRVTLNSNDHSELTWQGGLLEAGDSVTVPGLTSMGNQDMGAVIQPAEPVDAGAPMSLEAIIHEDPLGGYNLQVMPVGFEFAQSAGVGHEPGKGYAQLSINGEVFNRLYLPWFQVPALGEGAHTFAVTLLNNEGRPYHYEGRAMAKSMIVHEESRPKNGIGLMAGQHDTGSTQHAAGGHHGSGPDAAAPAASHNHGDSGHSGHDHGTEQNAGVTELEVGYLEVLP